MQRIRPWILLFFSLPLALQATDSAAVRDQHVVARVIGEMSHIEPGEPYRLGLLLKHDKGWHTYWKSTATGYAPSVNWTLPEGFSVSEFQWPTPSIYTQLGITDYIYKDAVLLVVTLRPPATVDAQEVTINFSAEWLMCENVCIPGAATGSLQIPVSDEPAEPSKWKSYFEKHDAALPVTSDAHSVQAWKTGNSIILQVDGGIPPGELIYFDALAELVPDVSANIQQTSPLQIRLTPDAATDLFPERLTGVLAANSEWPGISAKAIQVDVAVGTQPSAASPSVAISPSLLLLAFIGGLILNLMPCVFPVLGIKIMGFVEHAGADHAKVIRHGLTFAGGVLISFWTLAMVLIVLRSGGNQLGWGFQLQSPGFVLCLAILLFAFGLNMFGLFEFGQSAVGIGSGLSAKQGYAGSFFSGVLATVVATPCAAPFLAPALGAALALPPLASLAVFTAIALGLASPYLILSCFPALVNRLPRPGPWMESFKQSMSFLLFATVAYLLWVLAGQLSESAGYPPHNLLKVLFVLVVIALALWIFGRWGAFHKPARIRYTATGIAILLILGSTWSGIRATQPVQGTGTQIVWEKWEPGKAAELAQSGKLVYVDFTARWCVTCQTNKATVFSSQEVNDRFNNGTVVALKADWTAQDPLISEALGRFGRSAVPFNLVYGPGLEQPLVLPEILTPGIVLEALDQAEGNNQ